LEIVDATGIGMTSKRPYYSRATVPTTDKDTIMNLSSGTSNTLSQILWDLNINRFSSRVYLESRVNTNI
jgi:hypothetical protein